MIYASFAIKNRNKNNDVIDGIIICDNCKEEIKIIVQLQ
ncbi:hypothetical protein NPD8_4230 (plasmid) [Clostridium botulinum]|uniref:Uncharacterized protein n=1 Tax=Clostridium botulinum TaxID=1491 RepID=A0A1L7JNN8_CLOBO|nr:hypothetical protein NPD8_4230 [Clostridium botulinum]